MSISRRRFLHGSALGVTAVALGWRPSFPTAAPPMMASSIVATGGVRKIATWLPVSTEALEDVGAFNGYLRERLAEMAERRWG